MQAQRLQALSLRQLRFFAALAQDVNFSRAAERMAVSQPALSAAIRQMETLLELRLFNRTTHRVVLTDAGRALLPHVQRLLVTADNAFADMADAAAHQRATVRIGSIPSAVPIVADQLAAMSSDAAEPIEMMLSDGKSDALVEQLRTGALDVAICVHSQVDALLAAVPLISDRLLLLVHPEHRFAKRTSLPWAELSGHEVIHFDGGSIGELTSAAMRQNDLVPSTRYQVDQVDSLFGIVRAGLAVAVMPRLYTTGLGWGEVALVPLVQPRIVRRLVLLSRRGLAMEFPVGRRFVQTLAPRLAQRLAVDGREEVRATT